MKIFIFFAIAALLFSEASRAQNISIRGKVISAATGEGIAGGNGDQGRVGGSPNGKDYSGTPKNFGVRVLQISNQSFEDDFNENAKVAMDIVADDNGKVISATYQPRGSTTSNRQMIDIAHRHAFELKLGSADGGQKGTVVFNFKVKG